MLFGATLSSKLTRQVCFCIKILHNAIVILPSSKKKHIKPSTKVLNTVSAKPELPSSVKMVVVRALGKKLDMEKVFVRAKLAPQLHIVRTSEKVRDFSLAQTK